jgi:hypothetical protein
METNIQEIYTQFVLNLSPTERLQLATLILNDLVVQQVPSAEYNDTWSEEDQRDLVNFSLQYSATAFSDTEGV